MIASGGLSSSFYDQLLYYTRQKNGLNLFGEKEKSRTKQLDLHLTGNSELSKEQKPKDVKIEWEKDKIDNESVPLHSLTKLHCDPTRNCANNEASADTPRLNFLFLSTNNNNRIILQVYFIFEYYLLFIILSKYTRCNYL